MKQTHRYLDIRITPPSTAFAQFSPVFVIFTLNLACVNLHTPNYILYICIISHSCRIHHFIHQPTATEMCCHTIILRQNTSTHSQSVRQPFLGVIDAYFRCVKKKNIHVPTHVSCPPLSLPLIYHW